MSNLEKRLADFEIERIEIHNKMEPLKKELKPLSIRLLQVSRNINNIKYQIKNREI